MKQPSKEGVPIPPILFRGLTKRTNHGWTFLNHEKEVPLDDFFLQVVPTCERHLRRCLQRLDLWSSLVPRASASWRSATWMQVVSVKIDSLPIPKGRLVKGQFKAILSGTVLLYSSSTVHGNLWIFKMVAKNLELGQDSKILIPDRLIFWKPWWIPLELHLESLGVKKWNLPDESFLPSWWFFVGSENPRLHPFFPINGSPSLATESKNHPIRWISSGDLMIQKVVEQRKEVDVTRTAAMGH